MNHLHVDSVIKTFGYTQVLTDIFVSCKQGEIIGLLGRNGAGKSTLLKIVFGSLSADRKFVKIGDKILNTLFETRKLINYLPQHNFLPNQLRVKSIINLFCDKNQRALIKAHPQISKMLDMKSRHLSGGERRLLEIILIIYSESAYSLIDEPFNGLAPIFKEDIKSILREQSTKKGFIITDHDYRNIIDVASKLLIINDGGIKEINGLEELKYWGYLPGTA